MGKILDFFKWLIDSCVNTVILFCFAIGLGLIILAWTLVRVWSWHRAVKADEAGIGNIPITLADGREVKAVRGLCDRCEGYFDEVYVFENEGDRWCENCYRAHFQPETETETDDGDA